MSEQLVDRIAKAILGAKKEHQPRRLRNYRELEYEECQAGCRYEVGGSYEHQAGLAAQAVIDDLGLEERLRESPNPPEGMSIKTVMRKEGLNYAECTTCGATEYGCNVDPWTWAARHAREAHNWAGPIIESRVVSPWKPKPTE